MIINGNEVNHLFLKGQQFDSTEAIGKEVIFLNKIFTDYGLTPDGRLVSLGSSVVYPAGTTGWVVVAQVKNFLYIANPKMSIESTWVKVSDVTVLQSGGDK